MNKSSETSITKAELRRLNYRRGLQFVGAEEYFAFEGLIDGYFNFKDNPSNIQDRIVPCRMKPKLIEVYVLGFLLGKEIRSFEQDETHRLIMKLSELKSLTA